MLILDSANYLQFQQAEHVCSEHPDYDSFHEYIPYPFIFAWSLLKTTYTTNDGIAYYQQKYRSASVLYCSNNMLENFLQYTFYGINFGLAYDLIKTIKNPFLSANQRYKIIILVSPLFFLLLFPYWLIHIVFDMETLHQAKPLCGDRLFSYFTRPGEAALMLVYHLYAAYAVTVAFRGLMRKGLNQEIR